MEESDKARFLQIFNGCACAYRQELDENQIQIFWQMLEPYKIADIDRAFTKHLQSSKFFPAISEIIAYIPSAQGKQHLGPEEAWAIALRSFDESLPIVLTNQILEAKAATQDIWDNGDAIGARMAFREVYNRLLLTAGEPKWFLSLGDNKSLTADVVQEAVRLGRLPAEALTKYLGIASPTTTAKTLIEQSDKRHGTSTDLSRLGLH